MTQAAKNLADAEAIAIHQHQRDKNARKRGVPWTKLLATRMQQADWLTKGYSVTPVPRHPLLVELSKKPIMVKQKPNLKKVPTICLDLIRANNVDPNEVFSTGMMGNAKLGKWLGRCLPEGIVQAAVANVCNKEFEFVVDVSYKAILNMATTKHYTSCISDMKHSGKGRMIFHYLENPNIALLVCRAKNGMFLMRTMLRLLRLENGNPALLMGHPYGNAPANELHKQFTDIAVFKYGAYYGRKLPEYQDYKTSVPGTFYIDDCYNVEENGKRYFFIE